MPTKPMGPASDTEPLVARRRADECEALHPRDVDSTRCGRVAPDAQLVQADGSSAKQHERDRHQR
jgi:hypothetical protein